MLCWRCVGVVLAPPFSKRVCSAAGVITPDGWLRPSSSDIHSRCVCHLLMTAEVRKYQRNFMHLDSNHNGYCCSKLIFTAGVRWFRQMVVIHLKLDGVAKQELSYEDSKIHDDAKEQRSRSANGAAAAAAAVGSKGPSAACQLFVIGKEKKSWSRRKQIS